MPEACDISKRPENPDQNPSPEEITGILKSVKRIAVVGLSNKPERDSYRVGLYMKKNGYEIIPVHPNITEWDGQKAYKSVLDIPGKIDMVDMFVRADNIDALVSEINEKKPDVVWFQLGIVNNSAAQALRASGATVVQNKCVKIEHANLI